MRNLLELNRYRQPLPPEIAEMWGVNAYWPHPSYGYFSLKSPHDTRKLRIIASNGEGWDHVSVSLMSRIPSWREMSLVKRLFFLPDEVAMQLHVAQEDHISCHPYCLHLWRPHDQEIPIPPKIMVA